MNTTALGWGRDGWLTGFGVALKSLIHTWWRAVKQPTCKQMGCSFLVEVVVIVVVGVQV